MKISVDYEQLEAIAGEFSHHAEQTGHLYNNCLNVMEGLRSAGWIGEGAAAFYNEMDEQVLPALMALENALSETSTIVLRVMNNFLDTEDEAAQIITQTEAQNSSVYTVQSGDTLSAIAQRYGTTVDALVAANNIPNRDLIHPGQEIVIPGAGAPVNPPTPAPVNPPNGSPAFTPQQYNAVIDGLNVEGNPAYVKFSDGNPNTYDTYCNLFAANVADQMNAPLPLYVTDGSGNITKWLGATNMQQWLDGSLNVPGQYTQGPQNGWQTVDTAAAVQYANQGYLTIAAGHGHMAVVRPGNNPGVGTADVQIAQAGEHNFNQGPLRNGWGPYVNEVRFYVHVPH